MRELEKEYKPKSIDDFFISRRYKDMLWQYIRMNKGKSPLVIHGNRGVGKTTLAEIILKELGVMNIILVDKANINKVFENVQKYSLFGENGYIIENLDEYPESTQLTIFKKFASASVKFIITAIDLYKIPYTIRRNCEVFHLYNPNPNLIKKLVYEVLQDYNLQVPKNVVDKIVETHPHDIRALFNDLQVLINIKDWKLFMKNYNVRNYKYSLFSVLESFFNSENYISAVKSYVGFTGEQEELNAHITDNIINSHGTLKNKVLALRIMGEAMRFKMMGIGNKMKTWSTAFQIVMLIPELYRKNKLKITKLQTSKAVFEMNRSRTRLYQINHLIDKVKKKAPHYNREQILELLELYAYALQNGARIRSQLQREYGFTKEDVDNIVNFFPF